MIRTPLQNQPDPWISQLCSPGCLPPALVGHTEHVHPQCLMHVAHKEQWIWAKPSSVHVHPPITISSHPRSCLLPWGNTPGMDPCWGFLVSQPLPSWQGLEVEQIATYEDITPFRDMKAKWTVGEHPGEE